MEEWRNNIEYEGIEVSNLGNVRSYWNGRGLGSHLTQTPRILEQKEDSKGYLFVTLKNPENGKWERKRVDNLVLETFEPINVAMRDNFKPYHLEGIRDNALCDLEWINKI